MSKKKQKQIKKQKEIEQYDHKGEKRLNNPPVGLVTPETDRDIGKKVYSFDPHIDPELNFDIKRSEIEKLIDNGLSAESIDDAKLIFSKLKNLQEPYLNWAGKAEHTSFEVDTVSLHVHERIDPRTIIEAVRKRDEIGKRQMSLFEFTEENPPIREAIEFYKHKHNWSNRLIAGDSLLVMNSLLEKEEMVGKIQMIYMDPPYGIKYNSNFQPFVNERDVKDGRDEDLTQEPEMIKAFRDTWELGIHSYLTYLRDRLLLSRELLTESGSCFVQIGDENVNLVKSLMDEVFGKKNFICIINFQTTPYATSKTLAVVHDYLLWYAKDKMQIKYRQLFKSKEEIAGLDLYRYILSPDGKTFRSMTNEEIEKNIVPEGWKRYQLVSLVSQGPSKEPVSFEFEGKKYSPPSNSHWKVKIEGLERVAQQNRIQATPNSIRFRSFIDDFPISVIHNIWTDTITGSFTESKKFIVQTNPKVIERCILMTTDPGDLVLDPTCGSGTTAYAAEKCGRRWITCDTSRVAITLTKQRLIKALFDYYELAHPKEGVDSGFKYKNISHISLSTIAYDEPPKYDILYDQPIIDKSSIRVSGPFTVEAVPAPIVRSIDEIMKLEDNQFPPDKSLSRSGETLRQAEWRDEILKTGIRGKGGQRIEFSRVEPLPGTRWLHADAETKEDDPKRALLSFGPEFAPLEQRQVALAIEEAQNLVPKPKIIVFAAFQFDPEAAKDIDETNWPGITLLKVQMNADLFTEDLKKRRASSDSFWLIGQPDIKLIKIEKGKDKDKYQVEVLGFDYYNTRTGDIESGGKNNIAMWLLDADYDGRSLYPKQIFFPLSGTKEGWFKLTKNLKAEIDGELLKAYNGTVSLPFKIGDNNRIAIKIIDDRGIESLKIIDLK